MAFTSSFFSLSGQIERLQTAGATVLEAALSPFQKSNITANVSNPILKSGAEFIANNPYTTAAISTVASTGLLKTAVSKLPTVVKVVGSGAALVSTTAIIKNPDLASAGIKLSSNFTPEKLANLGGNIGTATKSPTKENLTKVVTENPALSIGLGLAATYLGAKAIGGASNLINAYQTRENTQTIKENTESFSKSPVLQNVISDNPDFLKLQEEYNKNQAKAAEEVAKLQFKSQEKAIEAQTEIAKINAKAALELEHEKTKQAEILSKVQPVPTPLSSTTQASPVTAATNKVTTKKKAKKKKKAKPKPKKKAKKKKKYKKKKK